MGNCSVQNGLCGPLAQVVLDVRRCPVAYGEQCVPGEIQFDCSDVA